MTARGLYGDCDEADRRTMKMNYLLEFNFKQVRDRIGSINKKKLHKYSNDKIIEDLKITKEEWRQLNYLKPKKEKERLKKERQRMGNSEWSNNHKKCKKCDCDEFYVKVTDKSNVFRCTECLSFVFHKPLNYKYINKYKVKGIVYKDEWSDFVKNRK